jgi:hypothetical protein
MRLFALAKGLTLLKSLLVSYDGGIYAYIFDDWDETKGPIADRLRNIIREKGVPNSNWGMVFTHVTTDDLMLEGLTLIEYDPDPERVDYTEVLTFEDDIPF